MQVETASEGAATPRWDRSGFRRELTPTWLGLVCLLSGHRPPGLDGAFRYAHLGGGRGVTSAVVAAVHPEAEVWAWSPTPADVEDTRRLRDAAELSNLVAHERPGLPADLGGDLVDVMVIEDLLVSASDGLRSSLMAAVEANLRPGGLVCVTYRTTVGWAEIVPVQRIMRHVARRFTGDPDRLVPTILELLDQLRQGGARHLTARPGVARWLDDLQATPPEVIMAEYLEAELRPVSHPQLADALGAAGCQYLGGARLTDDLGLDVPPALQDLVARAATPALRETYRDLAVRPLFRLDVFRRGPSPLSDAERATMLTELLLVGLGGETTDPPAVDDATWGRLRGSVVSATSLVADAERGPCERAVRQLVDDGHAHPIVPGGTRPGAPDACDRLNDVLAGRAGDGGDPVVAVPLLGSALPASRSNRVPVLDGLQPR